MGYDKKRHKNQKPKNFQFPLWDTKMLKGLRGGIISFFQFPLWDTVIFVVKRER